MFFTLNQRQRPYQWRVRFIKIGAEVKLYIKLLITDVPMCKVLCCNSKQVSCTRSVTSRKCSVQFGVVAVVTSAILPQVDSASTTFHFWAQNKKELHACFICVPTLSIGFFLNYMFLFLLGSAGSASCCRIQPNNTFSRYTPKSFACLHNLSDVGRTTTSM